MSIMGKAIQYIKNDPLKVHLQPLLHLVVESGRFPELVACEVDTQLAIAIAQSARSQIQDQQYKEKKKSGKEHTVEHILPSNLRIPTPKHQDILMDIATLNTAQHSRPESAVTNNLQLHTTTNRLGNTISPTQRLHLHSILGCAPGQQPRLERVCRGRDLAEGWVAS